MSLVRDFEDIYLSGKNGYLEQGKFKLSEAGIGWKNQTSGQIVTIPSNDIQSVAWMRVAREYEIKIVKKDNTVLKFDGFPKDSFENLQTVLNSFYNITLLPVEVSTRGYNWGTVDFEGSELQFNVSSKSAFEIPLLQVANSSLGAKNEVALEFTPPAPLPDGRKQREDTLVEIRFYVPGNATVGQVQEVNDGKYQFKDKSDMNVVADGDLDGEEGEISLAAQKEVLGDDNEPIAAASIFCDTIKLRMDTGITSEAIVKFEELFCLVPRGRYQVHMHPSFMRLRGKTHDYKILYTSIRKLFLVPKPDDLHWLFVIGLDPPLRQGQTRYPHLVFQFEKEKELEIELNTSKEELEEKFNGLAKSWDGPEYQVVTDIFTGVTNKKAVGPSPYFKSSHGQDCIKCSQKANEAILYPLEKGFLSIPKPTLYMPFSEISVVTFSRVSSTSNTSTKTFEMRFNLTSGVEYTFSSIPREEYNSIDSFCRLKKLSVRNELGDDGIQFGIESDGEAEDTRKRRSNPNYQDIYDGSESEDEDFNGAASDSDVEEEFNEDYSSEGEGGSEGGEKSEGEREEKVKKEKKKREKKDDQPKKRAKKDPNAPKRAMSAFLYYSQDHRPALIAENPGQPISEVAKLLGEKWKVISESEKAVYEEMARKDKERYTREMAAYVPGQQVLHEPTFTDVKQFAMSSEFIQDSDEE